MVPCHSAKSKISITAEKYPVVKVRSRRTSAEASGQGSQRSAGRWARPESKPRIRGSMNVRAAGTMPGDWTMFSWMGGTCCVGGDEETRTPDPLLAKEMLCQLSYVPAAGWVAWWAFLDSNQRPLPYQGSALTS